MTMSLHSEPVSSRDSRCAPRYELRLRAWCEHRAFTLYPTIRNLSRTGLFLQTTTPLPVGERVKVSVVPGVSPIVVEAEIVWSRRRGSRAGLGCAIVGFVEGADAYATLLEQLRRGTFEAGMREPSGCSWSVLSR